MAAAIQTRLPGSSQRAASFHTEVIVICLRIKWKFGNLDV
jgi:hypothetical protein